MSTDIVRGSKEEYDIVVAALEAYAEMLHGKAVTARNDSDSYIWGRASTDIRHAKHSIMATSKELITNSKSK